MTLKITALAIAAASLAYGNNAQSWVSSSGNDANACTRSAPCRTLAGALFKTNDGGTIHAIDAADYSPVTIDRSITIEGVPGASVYAPATGDAILINGPATTRVAIRNLVLYVNGPGWSMNTCGIREQATTALLHVEDVAIHNAPESVDGICAYSGRVYLRNVSVTGGASGVWLSNANLGADRVSTATNVGLTLSSANATIRDSVFRNGNMPGTGAGLTVTATPGTSSTVLLQRTELSQNLYGFVTNNSGTAGPVTIRLDASTITANSYAWALGAQTSVISFRNNVIAGNTNDMTPALTTSFK